MPDPCPDTQAQRFAAALLEVEAALDWPALGRLYCHAGGADFFDGEAREALRDTGLLFASDIARELERLPAGGPGRSLYVGAALAELAPILCETLVLGREVVALALPGPETEGLNGALEQALGRLGLPTIRILPPGAPQARGMFDHVWLVSVLTDPDAFPALHDDLYERQGTDLATNRGDLAADRERANALVSGLLEHLRPPCLLTTTDEELALVRPLCVQRGLPLEVSGTARLSGIVGDPVRLCRIPSIG
ncbi:MAG: hypothetical protein E2O39_07040 [Planctomycetota bacterium]|nr:MAG: hypothetical protein E2O39_07040 [Planctomycetota bacterium]